MNFKNKLALLLTILFAFPSVCALPLAVRAEGDLLSQGKKYTVSYETPIDNAFPARAYQQEDKLTDGKLAKNATYNEPEFLKLYRGVAAYVTVDLEAVCAVDRVEVRYLNNKAAGIYAPRYIRVAVSEDGESFGTVGVLEDPTTITSNSTSIVTKEVRLDGAYRARYVRVTICTDCYMYTDEISVYGSSDASGAKTAKADAPVEDRGYAGEIDGIGNIALMYTYGKYSSTVLRSFVAYTNAKGEATDTMFDAMLFLPSGASGFDYSTTEGWQAYEDELFGQANNSNLTALNKTVADLAEPLKLAADFRYPVFVSIPDFTVGNSPIFGIVPNSLENRLSIVQTFVDEVIARFESAGFDRLELKGFYWHEETVRYAVTDYEERLIQSVNEYVHGKGLKSIWVPYYCAPGYERAVELGFDAAALQSGYAFNRSADAEKEVGLVQAGAVADSAATAKKYGLGMEFEIDTNVSGFLTRYIQYLNVGCATGCMDGHMMMLYHGVNGMYSCATGGDGSDLRKAYDLTYQYVKGTYTCSAPVIQPGQVIVAPVGKRASGTLVITDEDSGKNSLKLAKSEVSEGLSCVVEGDGFYLVNTSDTLPGVYTFTLQVTDGFNLSAEETVYVLVTEGELPTFQCGKEFALHGYLTDDGALGNVQAGTEVSYAKVTDDWYYVSYTDGEEEKKGFAKTSELDPPAPQEPEESENPETSDKPGEKSGGMPGWLLGVIIGGAVVVVGAVACVVLSKKKKSK